MINPNSDSESIASTAAERVDARQKSKHETSGRLTTLIWRRDNNLRHECKREDSMNDIKAMEQRFKNPSSSKVSFGFFKNIKKHLQIKNLCKSKEKVGIYIYIFFFLLFSIVLCKSILLRYSLLHFFQSKFSLFSSFRTRRRKQILLLLQTKTLLYRSVILILIKNKNC